MNVMTNRRTNKILVNSEAIKKQLINEENVFKHFYRAEGALSPGEFACYRKFCFRPVARHDFWGPVV